MSDTDPPPVVSDVQTRHMLSFAPVSMIEDRARREALDSANGVDLTLRFWTRLALTVALLASLGVGIALVAR